MVEAESRKKAPAVATVAEQKKAKPVGSKKVNMGFGPMMTLLAFSTAMLIMPLATYFYILRYILDSTSIAAMGAVVVVQIIIAAYIYKAWSDENKEHQESLKKSKKKA